MGENLKEKVIELKPSIFVFLIAAEKSLGVILRRKEKHFLKAEKYQF